MKQWYPSMAPREYRYPDMRSDPQKATIAVFDLGGTWFRWGLYLPSRGLVEPRREPAISYLSHPHWSAAQLQRGLTDFVIRRTREMQSDHALPLWGAGVSIGAPVNAHDRTVLGSGPLWGPSGGRLCLEDLLQEAMPEIHWHVLNDVTALLAPYMVSKDPVRKTLLITVSTGVGARLYDHRTRAIPYDGTYGVQGEIGHLTLTFEFDGQVINRRCECGGWNHLNAFSSGRGIAHILKSVLTMSPEFWTLFPGTPQIWERASDEYRLDAFKQWLNNGDTLAGRLLDAIATPLSRTLATALSLDPEIDRIVITGGVAQGIGKHYREALQRAFLRDGLYQISEHDPQYLTRRLHWEEPDESGGLRGAGMFAEMNDTRARDQGGFGQGINNEHRTPASN